MAMLLSRWYEMFGFWTILFTVVLAVLLFSISNWVRKVLVMMRMPGPKGNFIFGHALVLFDARSMFDLHKEVAKQSWSLLTLWFSIYPIVVLLDPQYIQAVLSNPKHNDKNFFYTVMQNFLGKGLITSSGERWRGHRKLINPSFHINILEKYLMSFADGAKVLVNRLAPKAELSEFNIVPFINDSAYDILNEVMLGVPFKKDIDPTQDSLTYRHYQDKEKRKEHPWAIVEWFYRRFDHSTQELKHTQFLIDRATQALEEKLEDRRNGSTKEKTEGMEDKKPSLVDYMIDIAEKCKEFSQEDIVNELCTFMLAGQDSVGTALVFGIHLLAYNKEALRQAVEEQDEIFQESTRNPTLQDLRDMRYLERCLKETLRLYPPLPLISRKIGEELKLGEFTLPASTDVLIALSALHRHPSLWPEPDKFDPDRFLPENIAGRHPYSYIPFSAGPRNCIANKFSILEMKVLVSTLLRHYTLSPVPGREEIQLSYRMSIRAKGGAWLKITPRT